MKKPADQLLKEVYESCPYTIVQTIFKPVYEHVCINGIEEGNRNMAWDNTMNIRHGGNSLIGTASEIVLATLLTKIGYDWVIVQEKEQQKAGIDFKFKKSSWKNWYTLSCKTASIGRFFDFNMSADMAQRMCEEKVDRFGIVDPTTKRAFIIESSKLIGILRHESGYAQNFTRLVVDEAAIDRYNRLDNGKVIKSENVYDLLEGKRNGAIA